MSALLPVYRPGTVLVVAHAIVDEDVLQGVADYHWRLDSRGYVRRDRNLMLHREVMGVGPGGAWVDHENRDRLDCRRENLRLVGPAENSQNKTGWGGSSYRGVRWDRDAWRAFAALDRQKYNLGRFASELEAAVAAEVWRLAHMPYAVCDPQLAEHVTAEMIETERARPLAPAGYVSVQDLHDEINAAGLTLRVLADRLGWMTRLGAPDESRVRAMLGLCGRPRRQVRRSTAAAVRAVLA